MRVLNAVAAVRSCALINRYEYRIYSQDGEDGILLYLFSRIGVTNRSFVEFGVGSGRECNSANLSLNFGWTGLLMDCDEQSVSAARSYYRRLLGSDAVNVKIVQCTVTTDNINPVLAQNEMTGTIDLLSIDIDGNDYWIWNAITAIEPRVVVIEYNTNLGPTASVVAAYSDGGSPSATGAAADDCAGASLAALTELAHAKGYMLVGSTSNRVNAFFVRRDVGHGKLTELSVEDAYFPAERGAALEEM